jgi:uncharacterized protein YukE
VTIHTDPEFIRKFAAMLQRFNTEALAAMQRTKGQLGALSSTWRDPAFTAFCEQFERTHSALLKFTAEAEAIRPTLLRDAELAERAQR